MGAILLLVHEGMFVLEKIVVDGGDVNALEHDSIPHDFRHYELLLKFGVLDEILKLVLAELGHA